MVGKASMQNCMGIINSYASPQKKQAKLPIVRRLDRAEVIGSGQLAPKQQQQQQEEQRTRIYIAWMMAHDDDDNDDAKTIGKDDR